MLQHTELLQFLSKVLAARNWHVDASGRVALVNVYLVHGKPVSVFQQGKHVKGIHERANPPNKYLGRDHRYTIVSWPSSLEHRPCTAHPQTACFTDRNPLPQTVR